MQIIKHQKGMTAIGWMLVIILLVSAALLAMKIFPIYIEGYNVRSVVKGLSEDPDIGTLQAGQIKSRILKRLSVNMVHAVSKDDVYVTPSSAGYLVELDYEVRENVVGNLDIVVAFNYSTDVQKK